MRQNRTHSRLFGLIYSRFTFSSGRMLHKFHALDSVTICTKTLISVLTPVLYNVFMKTPLARKLQPIFFPASGDMINLKSTNICAVFATDAASAKCSNSLLPQFSIQTPALLLVYTEIGVPVLPLYRQVSCIQFLAVFCVVAFVRCSSIILHAAILLWRIDNKKQNSISQLFEKGKSAIPPPRKRGGLLAQSL